MIPVSAIRRKGHLWLTEEAWIHKSGLFSTHASVYELELLPCNRYDLREGSFWVARSGKIFRVYGSEKNLYGMCSHLDSDSNWEYRDGGSLEYRKMYFEPISPLHILFKTL
jgi:hypothetical protein